MGAPDPVHQFPETTVLSGNSKVQPKPSDVERAIEQMTDDTQGLHPTLVNHQGDYHPHQRQVVQQHLDKMLRNGIIEPSKGPWSSPVVLVKKKKVRPQDFVDFRKVNDLTKKDAGLMTHDSLGGLSSDSSPLPYMLQMACSILLLYCEWRSERLGEREGRGKEGGRKARKKGGREHWGRIHVLALTT